jgi:hypothetical protein
MSLRAIYSPPRLINAAPIDRYYDGAECVLYKDGSGNPALHLFVGWRDEDAGVSGSFSFAHHWRSTDHGATWTQLADPPYTGRHNNGVHYNDALDEITIVHGDGTIDPHNIPQDVWGYHYVTGWHLHTSSTGMGSRQGCTHGHDEKYLYMVNGYQLWNENVNNICRALKSNPASWEIVGSTVGTALENVSNGWMTYHKGKQIIAGGGWRRAGMTNIVNTKVFQSKDHLQTFTQIADTPLMDSGLWSRGRSSGDCIIYRSGSDANNATHRKRLLITTDAVDWKLLPTYIPGDTDAFAMVFDELGDLHTGMGFHHDEWYVLKRMTNMYL